MPLNYYQSRPTNTIESDLIHIAAPSEPEPLI
jgi:hypothetical protein